MSEEYAIDEQRKGGLDDTLVEGKHPRQQQELRLASMPVLDREQLSALKEAFRKRVYRVGLNLFNT